MTTPQVAQGPEDGCLVHPPGPVKVCLDRSPGEEARRPALPMLLTTRKVHALLQKSEMLD